MTGASASLRSKTCSKCGTTYPLDDFPPRKSSKDGKHGWCRPCFRAYYVAKGREWRDKNREHHRAVQRRRYAVNREKNQQRKREWDEANREIVNARARERYYRDYADPIKRAKMLDRNARRRAIIQEASSPELIDAIAAMYAEPCTYCGSTEEIEIDHIVPLKRGGPHAISNLTPACGPCNRSKKDKPLADWRPELAEAA